MAKYKHFLGLGIAGNFALHLEQAGEASDFDEIVTKEDSAPKGMFPVFLPNTRNAVNEAQLKADKQLHVYPYGADVIKLPKDGGDVHMEPEVALICDMVYEFGLVKEIKPRYFTAYNDATIRADKEKISQKKNWSHECKGVSNNLIEVKGFSENSNMDHYNICSFLKRDGEIHRYGEDVEINGYSYFHQKLLDWMVEQINNQENFGPLECISEYIQAVGNPQEAIISIGATRYTEFGENTYLKEGDECIVILYNRDEMNSDEVFECVKNSNYKDGMSVLAQKVVHAE